MVVRGEVVFGRYQLPEHPFSRLFSALLLWVPLGFGNVRRAPRWGGADGK
jgi:hypothetical protein